jgi:TonB family protein
MLRFILTLALFSFSCHSFFPTPITAGESSKTQSEDHIAFDSYPAPVGGFEALAKNVKYPEAGLKSGTQGRVVVTVSFDDRGSIEKTEVAESMEVDFDKAAVEAIQKTKWTPAIAEGQPVACQVNIPIQFKLENKKKSENK